MTTKRLFREGRMAIDVFPFDHNKFVEDFKVYNSEGLLQRQQSGPFTLCNLG